MQSHWLLPGRILLVGLAAQSLVGCSQSAKPHDGGGADTSASAADGKDGSFVCFSFRECDPGDEMIGHGGVGTDPRVGCPSGRECYVLPWECGNSLCALPVGVHCSDSLACASGEVATPLAQCFVPSCHTKSLCGNQIGCLSTVDAGMADAETVETGGETAAAADAKDAAQTDTAECYEGQVSSCTWTPTYDPCRDYKCMGYSMYCSNGQWQADHCEPVIDAGHSSPADAAVDKAAQDLPSDPSPIDGTPSIDGVLAEH
jgi:hypothetical protein